MKCTTGCFLNLVIAKFLRVVLILALSAELVLGGVEIVRPYHPLYIKVGSSLTIACESESTKSATELKWIHQTPQTSWADQLVVPERGSNIIIQLFREEPSGFTRSTLIKHNMSLLDRGTYICKDDGGNSYAVWVVVLHITAQNVPLSSKVDLLILSCSISGFDSNVPTIDFDWTFNGSFISYDHDLATSNRHSPALQAPTGKYNITTESTGVWLEIHDPSSLDGGSYNCVFTLGTNLGPVTFTETLRIDGSLLTFRSAGLRMNTSLDLVVIAVFLFSLKFL